MARGYTPRRLLNLSEEWQFKLKKEMVLS